MTLMGSDVASLSKLLSSWELAEYVSAAFVALACAGEGVADFTNWFTGGAKRRKERLAKMSTLLLIVSLSIELVCLVRTNSLSGRLIGSLADRAETADKEARSALTDSSSAKMESLKARQESSDALKIASNARQEAASFKLEIRAAKQEASEANKKLADRVLTDEQARNITQKLSKFPGQLYTVTAYWDSKESMNIALRIHHALANAHWQYDGEGSKSVLLGGTIGIYVSMHPNADEVTSQAAYGLVDALVSDGLEASIKVQNPKNNPKHNKIWINIGAKR